MKIVTLGPRGTYAEQAALAFAKRKGVTADNLEIYFTSVINSLRQVQNLKADYAIIPAENMIDGLIGSSFDALIEFHDFVKVCDEVHLLINHVLAAKPGVDWSKLKYIYSHPSPLNQCQNRLAELFPQTELIALPSTAEAVENVLNEKEALGLSAAICNLPNAKAHQMALFNQEIQDYSINETRFLICSLTDSPPTGNDSTLLAVRYGSNHPGLLYQTTKYLADAGVDLTFVHSRPYKVKPQEYVLIFEFAGHKSEPAIETALKNIELQVRTYDGWKKILGSYPRREREV